MSCRTISLVVSCASTNGPFPWIKEPILAAYNSKEIDLRIDLQILGDFILILARTAQKTFRESIVRDWRRGVALLVSIQYSLPYKPTAY